ncbi:MAG: hypothetical protein JWR38_2267 [Mucilaginibacter sp.]|nr:hypothetical protein [Mucilaginibacter sp.]
MSNCPYLVVSNKYDKLNKLSRARDSFVIFKNGQALPSVI